MGIFNATVLAETLTMKAMVEGCLAGAGTSTTFAWETEEALKALGSGADGEPLVSGGVVSAVRAARGRRAGFHKCDCTKAIAKGLTFRSWKKRLGRRWRGTTRSRPRFRRGITRFPMSEEKQGCAADGVEGALKKKERNRHGQPERCLGGTLVVQRHAMTSPPTHAGDSHAGNAGAGKSCAVKCGVDCTSIGRVKDERGRYFCKACYDKAIAAMASRIIETAPHGRGRDEDLGAHCGVMPSSTDAMDERRVDRTRRRRQIQHRATSRSTHSLNERSPNTSSRCGTAHRAGVRCVSAIRTAPTAALTRC